MRRYLAPLWPLWCGALVLLTAGFLQVAQDGSNPLGFLLSLGGFGMGAGGLVAWGRQQEAVNGLKDTVPTLATKAELQNVHTDVREIRSLLERRKETR